MQKYAFLLPHNWLDLKGLRRVFLGAFYADFLIMLYTFYNFVSVWLAPAETLAVQSAPLRRLWTAALLQELLLAVLLLLLAHGLGALWRVRKETSSL